MRSSHAFTAFAQLALLTLALVSCGGQTVPQAQSGTGSSGSAVTTDKVVTLKVRAGTTQADLESRYPGARVLALHADEGYAIVKMTSAVMNARPLATLSLAAQDVAVTDAEDDATLVANGEESGNAEGYNAWAGGYNAWAGGYNAWAGGTTTPGTVPTFLAENQPAFALTNIASGQQAAPRLGQGVKVAVIDTGVDVSHPGFGTSVDAQTGWDYVGGDGNVNDQDPSGKFYGHGTAVAGIIHQVAPNATIVPWRVLSSNGSGKLSDVIMAVNDATKYGANIINMSLGTNAKSTALYNAVSSAIRKGVMVVSSSGNSGDTNVTYPARYAPDLRSSLGGGLISVGSIDARSLKSNFSTYGAGVDVEMPGEQIATLYPGNRRVLATGTSFAAPQMSGAIALAMSKGITDVKTLTQGIQYYSTPSADPAYGRQLGWGTPNVGAALGAGQ